MPFKIVLFCLLVMLFSVDVRVDSSGKVRISDVAMVKTDSLVSAFVYQLYYQLQSEDERMIFLRDSVKPKLNELEKNEAVRNWNALINYKGKKDANFVKEIGYCYYNLAIKFKNEADYFNAYQAYVKCKINYEMCQYKTGMVSVENSLGNFYKDIDKYQQSVAHYSKSAQLCQELNDSVLLGWIYLNLGAVWEKQDSLEFAIMYLKKSQGILEVHKDKDISNCYINLGEVFNKKNNYDSAYFYHLKSYEFSQMNGNIVDKFQSSFHFGEFLFNQNRISEATPIIEYLKDISEDQNILNQIKISDRANVSKLFSEFYETKGDLTNAYLSLKDYIGFELENKREQSIREMQKMEFEYQLSVSELQFSQRLNMQKIRNRWTLYISVAVFFASLLLLFSFYRNYKHKKEANRLLTEMDELKNKLYSNITHELRTPLTLILSPLEQMLSTKTENTPSRKQVKMMRKNANSLLTLVNQMLDLTKIDAKHMKLELVEDDINKFLRTRFAVFASLADQKQITYNCSLLHEKNIQIFDASKLEKIINNLLSNAIKFTDKKGFINCYVNFQPPKLEIIVQDNGKGIPTEDVYKIFNRFHQVTSNKDIFNIGTGIGLALTKELVDLMHGNIEVESETGKGSKFTVTLPLGTEHLNSDEYQMIQNLNSGNNKKSVTTENIDSPEECFNIKDSNIDNRNLPNVLIIDDNPDIREYIAESLSNCFNTITAKNGKTGLKRAVKHIPDLVITDVVMPKMDGIEVCNKLKTDERTSHIPVIMLTGKSATDDRLKGLENGADAYLTKPFNIKELTLRVNNLIEQRRKLRERFTQNHRFEPKDIAVTSVDEKFITRAMEIIEKNISNSEFEVRHFQNEMFMSRMQLFRKIKALTNQTPSEFIRTIRLKRAAQLIKQNFGNIAQITFEVGFNNPSYFAKCFKDLFGELPSDYAKNHQIT